MARTIKVKNLDRLQAAFVSAGKDAPRFAAKALFEETQEAFLLSQVVTPICDGYLRASGVVLGPFVRGSRVYTSINYGGPAAPYAVFVHELPPSRAKHDPPTRWKFLANPVRLYAETMGERMASRVLDMIERRFDIS